MKLSKTQRDVLQSLADGGKLYEYFMRFTVVSADGKRKTVSYSTYNALWKRQAIERDSYDDGRHYYKATDAGKQAVIAR